MTTVTAPDSTSAEQAADFAALQATANDAPPVPGSEEEAQQQRPDLGTEIAGLITVAVATLGPVFPSLRETYTPEITQAAAGAIAAVCNKHGWMQGGMLGEWGEEIACLVIVGPLAFSTVQGIKSDLAKKAPPPKTREQITAPGVDLNADRAAPGPGQSVGSKTVSFGAVVPSEA
jgi:hypothetical protein